MISRRELIIIITVFSLVLYGLGVASGLLASKVVRTATQKDIATFAQSTEEELQDIENNIKQFRSNLETIQIQQSFLTSFEPEVSCSFSQKTLSYFVDELGDFWARLPYRIEAYSDDLSYKEYLNEYTFLAIKAWILSTRHYNTCDQSIVPILYFYDDDCPPCVKQGEEIDNLKNEQTQKEIIAFAINLHQNEPIVDLLKQFYAIEHAPAMVINQTVLQKKVYSANEISKIIN